MNARFTVAVISLLAVQQCLRGDVDWNTVPVIDHKTYQSVDSTGLSNYAGGFPIRLVGVVLNNSEDWLDPTPAYDSGYHPYQQGGQAEIFVQTVSPGDFGGTSAWIGQNYGNMPWLGDSSFSYTNAQWTAELGRLGLQGGDGVATPVRAGDLVEIRARMGLFYAGKNNINENHSTDTANDFEIVIVQRNYGLPTATPLSLSNLEDSVGQFYFDASRATGPEHYQGSLVELKDVRFTAETISLWGQNADLRLEDATGRELPIHLGYSDSFAAMSAPTGYFSVSGIFDQADSTSPNDSGYRLLAMSADAFVPVPEPTALGILLPAAALLCRRRRA